MTNKYISMLGLARRAGKLDMGHDTVCDAVRKRRVKLLVLTSDSAKRLEEELLRLTEQYCRSVPCVRIPETMDEIHFSLGYRAGVMAVNDSNFATRIIELIQQEGNTYGD